MLKLFEKHLCKTLHLSAVLIIEEQYGSDLAIGIESIFWEDYSRYWKRLSQPTQLSKLTCYTAP